LVTVGLAAIASTVWVAGASVGGPKSCAGGFRWDVKTLSDPAAPRVDYKPVGTAIAKLLALVPPSSLGDSSPRAAGTEMTTYRVTAALDHMDLQADGDIHLVIADPRDKTKMMLAEFPNVACPGPDHSYKKQQLRAARLALTTACGAVPPEGQKERLGGKLVITGVGFFDTNKQFNPTGVELHPVLAIKKISCKRLGTYRFLTSEDNLPGTDD
jgi:hypothetical protein